MFALGKFPIKKYENWKIYFEEKMFCVIVCSKQTDIFLVPTLFIKKYSLTLNGYEMYLLLQKILSQNRKVIRQCFFHHEKH